MKSILIPTDFSKTALNAIEYALGLASQLKINNIILLHALQPLISNDSVYSFGLNDMQIINEVNSKKLEEDAYEIKKNLNCNISITTKIVVGNLENCIAEFCNENSVDYIVMGITGGSNLQDKIIGSNTLNVSESVSVPLIIVPSECKFKHISKVTFLCDYVQLEDHLPVEKLQDILDSFSPVLEVLHVSPTIENEENISAFEIFYLHNFISKYQPNYKYVRRDDFKDAVNDLVEESNIQMIISISKQKNWLQKLFNSNHIKQLAFYTKVPMLILNK